MHITRRRRYRTGFTQDTYTLPLMVVPSLVEWYRVNRLQISFCTRNTQKRIHRNATNTPTPRRRRRVWPTVLLVHTHFWYPFLHICKLYHLQHMSYLQKISVKINSFFDKKKRAYWSALKITENYRCHSETVRCSHIKPIDRRNCISNDSLNFSHFIRKTEWQTDKESRLSFRCYRVFLIMRFSSCCHDNSPSPQLPDSVCFECIGGSQNAYMPKKLK